MWVLRRSQQSVQVTTFQTDIVQSKILLNRSILHGHLNTWHILLMVQWWGNLIAVKHPSIHPSTWGHSSNVDSITLSCGGDNVRWYADILVCYPQTMYRSVIRGARGCSTFCMCWFESCHLVWLSGRTGMSWHAQFIFPHNCPCILGFKRIEV